MLDELATRASRLVDGGRAIIGIAGCPGAGKSTLAEQLIRRLAPQAENVARVPMDGFHLSDAALDRLGRRRRKGAIDTFDAYGYLAMIVRLRGERDHPVYAPDFHRTIEQPIAGSIAVGPHVRLVITEGNYILSPEPPWPSIRREMSEVWYVELDDAVRLERLVERHVMFGKTPAEARRWVREVDEANSRHIRPGRDLADVVVDMALIESAPRRENSAARSAR
jgi:pantothenate kinase